MEILNKNLLILFEWSDFVKKLIVFVSAVVTMVIIGYISVSNLVGSEPALYKKVSSDQIKKMKEEQETFIAYFYQENCAPCKQVNPIINDYIQTTGKDIFAVDINADKNKNLLMEGFNIEGTPTVIFINSGKEENRFLSVFGKDEFKNTADLIYGDSDI